MPSTKNVDALAQIKEDLADVQAVWVVDYRGLTVKEAQELRRNIREAGAVMKVYKNTLMHIALKELDMADMDEILSGPSAFVFADGDPVASAKALRDFSKDNETLVIKGGIMDGKFVDARQSRRSQLFLRAKNSSRSFSVRFRTPCRRSCACSTHRSSRSLAPSVLSPTRRMQPKRCLALGLEQAA